MKKIITLFTALAISFAIISCGSTPEVESQEPEAPVSPAEAEEDTSVEVTGQEMLVDDFEEGMFWEAVGTSWNDGDVSIECDLSTDWGTEGGTSLKCTVTTNGGEWEKGGFFTIPYDANWSNMTMISLDVYNPNEFDINICPVLQDGENWEEWNQFTQQTVPAGEEVSLTFEIPSKKYLSVIQRLIIYSFGAVPEECSFYIDNIVAKN